MKLRRSTTNAQRRCAALLCVSVAVGSLLVSSGLGSEAAPSSANQPTVVLVLGAPGEPQFSSNFVRQVTLWTNACQQGQARTICIGFDKADAGTGAVDSTKPATTDHDRLQSCLATEIAETSKPLWLVFIGHGTFDGKEARFNLRGPDVTGTELRDWLRPLHRPLVFIDTTSASAPFLNLLSATNRVIITATRSGNEQNFAHFGLCFAEALTASESDLDQDGQTSVLEAFLSASGRTAEFYKTQGRLATEHALLDDNGDGLGTPADWFRGIRAVKKPEGRGAIDGARAHQFALVPGRAEQELPAEIRLRRDALELSIARFREAKSQHSEADYYRELEKLLLQLQAAYGEHL